MVKKKIRFKMCAQEKYHHLLLLLLAQKQKENILNKVCQIKTKRFVKMRKTTSRIFLQRRKKNKPKSFLFNSNCLFGNNLNREKKTKINLITKLTCPSASSKIVFLISLPVVNHFVVRNFKFVGGSTDIS